MVKNLYYSSLPPFVIPPNETMVDVGKFMQFPHFFGGTSQNVGQLRRHQGAVLLVDCTRGT